ncbi:T4 RnlA family RNA ligase [Flavobacterium collinsii]|uniref:RNA_lig_T4_1 domain-containing protein n=1 Tax=Flavobacterium collinsii TaxID=1114861 RepID=A0A9W4TKQ2_9FLAO|nr:T4 RnlA family RNA ligase [Flavobacterium collinsii]CAI2769090.1 RNA_lig_T4_1 domain-containing protein [Flavobacterium collinsii]
MNTTLLKEMLSKNYVKVNKHPKHDLYIYNYTQNAQFEKVWNEVTLACRGLILDENDNVVARPFLKFFNLGEMENQVLPDCTFEVYDKMDGSLGILYWIDDIPFMASRGSFSSDQSDKANEMLHGKYRNSWSLLDKAKTYLFEIIYPENRIVLDYGAAEELVLLAVIDTQSGEEFPLEDIGFPVVEKFDGIKDILILREMEVDNKEGFIIKYANDFRVKIKFEEYLRLHRIITQVSNLNIWEYLKTNQSMEEILERVPDEFFDWVKQTKSDLENQYQIIENQCKADFKVLESRKETALYFQTCQYQGVLFAMLNNKDYSVIIWKMIRPIFEKPFNREEK